MNQGFEPTHFSEQIPALDRVQNKYGETLQAGQLVQIVEMRRTVTQPLPFEFESLKT